VTIAAQLIDQFLLGLGQDASAHLVNTERSSHCMCSAQ
jgi:hypothetical protein